MENDKHDALIKHLLEQVQHLSGNVMAMSKESELKELKKEVLKTASIFRYGRSLI